MEYTTYGTGQFAGNILRALSGVCQYSWGTLNEELASTIRFFRLDMKLVLRLLFPMSSSSGLEHTKSMSRCLLLSGPGRCDGSRVPGFAEL